MTASAEFAEDASRRGDAEPMRARLKEIIRERSFSEGETRRLASGRASAFYFNMKRTLSQPEGLYLVAELMLREIRKEKCDVIGGLEMGAVPILNSVAMLSFQKGAPIPLFWIRKKAKEHGTRELIEGEDAEALAGKTAVMVEDVTTTGGSVLKAIGQARENAMTISTVLTIVDRMEGASENLAAHGVALKALFTADDFRS